MEPTDHPDDEGAEPEAVDIGVGASGERARQRDRKRADAVGSSERDPGSTRRMVGIAAVVIAAIAIIGTLFSGDDQQAQDNPPPPTSPPEVLTPFPDVVRPTPSVDVPVVSQGLTRAGEKCRIPYGDDDYLAEVVFTVPDGRTMRECNDKGPLLRDPRAKQGDSLGEVAVFSQSFGAMLSSIRSDAFDVERSHWQPVNGRRAYRIDLRADQPDEPDRLHVIDVPGGTVVVTGRGGDFAAGVGESIDALVESVRVEGPAGLPSSPLPNPGGWCAGDHFTAAVPAEWFADEACRWFNTSSESATVLQCECLPPLWIEHFQRPLDGDYGFSRIDSDVYFDRADGSRGRVIEGLRLDANNMERPLRSVIVDGGIERVAVLATEFPEHATPGHSWQATLDAQQFVVDNVHFHSDPACTDATGGERRITAAGEDRFVEIEIGDTTFDLPAGSTVVALGCQRVRPDGSLVEVRLEARPTVFGWIAANNLQLVEVGVCPSGDRSFSDVGWDDEVVGDFDGDGQPDRAYTKIVDRSGVQSISQLSDLAVVFANGGVARSLVGATGTPTAERIVGVGRDAIGFTTTTAQGEPRWKLFAVSTCEVERIFAGNQMRSTSQRDGFCRSREGLTDSLRWWREEFDAHQGWVAIVDERWAPAFGTAAQDQALAVYEGEAPCGPDLSPRAYVDGAIADATLAGAHRLSLQWLSSYTDSFGRLLLEPLAPDVYKATGTHKVPFGELILVGEIRVVGPDELAFEGEITSVVPWLNAGQPCVRNAGQRFVRRPSTDTFRMQDRINCDGGRTDWIDITLAEGLLSGS